MEFNPCFGIIFSLPEKLMKLKRILPAVLIILSSFAKAQKIESIYVNLYTDSLKKGTFNYINVDGLCSDGKYMPLDSSQVIFTSSAGKFFGNTLFIERNFIPEKIEIKVVLKNNPALHKEFTMYIKKLENPSKLPTADEIINQMQNKPSRKRKKG